MSSMEMMLARETMTRVVLSLNIRKSTKLDIIIDACVTAGVECFYEHAREIKAAVLSGRPLSEVI